jgi:hypothetical protein
LKNPQGSLCGFFFGLTAKSAKDYCVKNLCEHCETFAFSAVKNKLQK